jgi:hypothetical protein
MPLLLGNLKLDTPVVARQPKVKHLHEYAHHSVLSHCMDVTILSEEKLSDIIHISRVTPDLINKYLSQETKLYK